MRIGWNLMIDNRDSFEVESEEHNCRKAHDVVTYRRCNVCGAELSGAVMRSVITRRHPRDWNFSAANEALFVGKPSKVVKPF